MSCTWWFFVFTKLQNNQMFPDPSFKFQPLEDDEGKTVNDRQAYLIFDQPKPQRSYFLCGCDLSWSPTIPLSVRQPIGKWALHGTHMGPFGSNTFHKREGPSKERQRFLRVMYNLQKHNYDASMRWKRLLIHTFFLFLFLFLFACDENDLDSIPFLH